MIYYGCGLAVAAIIGVAAGTRYIERHGATGLLTVVALTVFLGAIIGWALDGYVALIHRIHPY